MHTITYFSQGQRRWATIQGISMEVARPAGMLRDTVDSIDWSYMRATDLSRLAGQYQEARPARGVCSGDGLKEFPK